MLARRIIRKHQTRHGRRQVSRRSHVRTTFLRPLEVFLLSAERTISRITNPGRCAGQRRLDGTWRFLQRSPHRPPRGRTAPRHSCRENGGVEGETRRDLAFLTDHAPIRRRRRPTGGRRPGPAVKGRAGHGVVDWHHRVAGDKVIERPDAPCRPGPPTARASAGQRPGRRRPRPRRCRPPSPCTGRCVR